MRVKLMMNAHVPRNRVGSPLDFEVSEISDASLFRGESRTMENDLDGDAVRASSSGEFTRWNRDLGSCSGRS
jgi:hypothetical protein